jgi:hypothetical protein
MFCGIVFPYPKICAPHEQVCRAASDTSEEFRRTLLSIQAGLIFLKASPGKGHLGHSNSFAPIGEAVFRSSADQHACTLEHGRRG